MWDERYSMHRYKSTSFAGIAGAIAMAGWFSWERFATGQFRVDLMIILTIQVVTKLGFMIYYRLRD